LTRIFTVDLTLCSKYQIYGEDFVDFSGLLRNYELYTSTKYISYHYHQTLIHTYIMLCLAQAKFFSCHFLGCEPLFINIVALLYEKVFEI